MPKCVYCGKNYNFPKGLTLVGRDGSVNYLCSAKCRKNMKMKRRKVRWILKSKKQKGALPEATISKKSIKEEIIKEKVKKQSPESKSKKAEASKSA